MPSRAASRDGPPSAFAAPSGHGPRPASPAIVPRALRGASVPPADGGADVLRCPTASPTARRGAPASPPPPPPPPMVDEAPRDGGDDGEGGEGRGEGRGETNDLSHSRGGEASARYQRDSILLSSCGISTTGRPSFGASSAEATRFTVMVTEGEEKRHTALTGVAKCRRDALPELSAIPPYAIPPYGAPPHGASPHGGLPYGWLPHGATPLLPLVGDNLGGVGTRRAALAADTYGELPLGLVQRHVKSAGGLPRSHSSPSHRFPGAGSPGAPVLMNYDSVTIAAAAGGMGVRGRGVRAAEARQQREAHAALGRVLRDSGVEQKPRKPLPAEARVVQVQATGPSLPTYAFASPLPAADGGGKETGAEAELRQLRSIVERARQEFPAFTERGAYCATNAAHLARVYKACFQELVRQVSSK